MAAQSPKLWAKGNPSPYQLHDITHHPDWGTIITCDAFFNNLASGFMIIICLAWFCGPAMYAALAPVALVIAFLLLATDLILLVADLGDPWRFYHCLRVMRFTSPLSVGVWGLSCFALFLFFGIIFAWWSVVCDCLWLIALARLFNTMAFIAAVVVICYKGVAFSCTSQPGVKDARWLTSFMVSDSLVMGLSLYILMCLCLDPMFAKPLILPMITLIIARSITFGLLWQDVKTRARKVYRQENEFIAWTVIGACGAVSIILLFLGIFGLALASLLNLVCGYLERHWVIGLARPM